MIAVVKVQTWFQSLSSRERLIVGITSLSVLLYIAWLPFASVISFFDERELHLAQRTRVYNQMGENLNRYFQLNEKLQRLQSTFKNSQMTFEDVTRELDQIIKKAVGSADYELDKNRTPSALGGNYLKQIFTVKIKEINLSQLVTLLYSLEHGQSPLFLGKIDVTKTNQDKSFLATMEIYSIGASQVELPSD
ncbi:MAG: hypothetical protein PHC51_12440 [bacterium]|nr:hypothetical protein [bacterium]